MGEAQNVVETDLHVLRGELGYSDRSELGLTTIATIAHTYLTVGVMVGTLSLILALFMAARQLESGDKEGT